VRRPIGSSPPWNHFPSYPSFQLTLSITSSQIFKRHSRRFFTCRFDWLTFEAVLLVVDSHPYSLSSRPPFSVDGTELNSISMLQNQMTRKSGHPRQLLYDSCVHYHVIVMNDPGGGVYYILKRRRGDFSQKPVCESRAASAVFVIEGSYILSRSDFRQAGR
jgi:hypothetical protein